MGRYRGGTTLRTALAMAVIDVLFPLCHCESEPAGQRSRGYIPEISGCFMNLHTCAGFQWIDSGKLVRPNTLRITTNSHFIRSQDPSSNGRRWRLPRRPLSLSKYV